jgi:ribose transport system substrate-binding protein
MKKIVNLLAAIAMIGFVLVGCSTEPTGSSSDSDSGSGDSEKTGKVGFSVSTLNNPFFVSMADGAEAKAKELGLELTVVDAGNDTAKQSTDIEDLITAGIEVLIVNPEDSAAVGPSIQSAIDAGIKVIAVDRTVEGAAVDTFIGTDNVKAGEAVGAEVLSILGEGQDIAILEGVPGASSAIDRHQGFLNALEGKVNIVASQTANYDRAEGMTVTENILQANPNIKAIVAANDEMALGAIEAITAANKKPGVDILVTGFDAGDDAINKVKEDAMLFTVEQQTVRMGELAVETASKMMNGEDFESEIPIDVTLLDKEALENQ